MLPENIQTKKNIDLSKVENAVVLFKKHGINVSANFVIGVIGEKKKIFYKVKIFIFVTTVEKKLIVNLSVAIVMVGD